MRVVWTVFSLVFVQLVSGTGGGYEVPEPTIEVFAPKGLRISIQDSRDVEEVEFIVHLPRVSDSLVHKAHKTDRGLWVYWNPDVTVHLHEKVRYKLMVKHLGLYCVREGVHVVQKVIGGSDPDCEENHEGQKVIAGFSGTEEFDHRMGRFASGKSSNFKSSYSMQKDSSVKPILKSSKSTTSGTFYMNPSGVVEASGYKSGSSFDSTRNEGEQWEHYRSDLTAEELEEMRRSGFRGLDIHGKIFPGSIKSYDQSYSEFKNFPSTVQRLGFGTGPVKTEFHETHETHESSSFSHTKPTVRFQFEDTAGAGAISSGGKSENSYRFESASRQTNSVPPTGTVYKASEYVRDEHTPREPYGESSSTQNFVQMSHAREYSSRNPENVKPLTAAHMKRDDEYKQIEYNSGKVQTMENRQDYSSRSYDGSSIFTSFKSTKARFPEECALTPGSDYTPSDNVRKVEKFAYELSCLATVAESSMRKEIGVLKQRNSELERKLESLEQNFRKFENSCRCY